MTKLGDLTVFEMYEYEYQHSNRINPATEQILSHAQRT